MKKKSAPPVSNTGASFQKQKFENEIATLKKQIQDSRRFKELLEERLKFEELLSDISSEYSRLRASEIDKTIEYSFKRIGRFLGADRCSLTQFTEDTKTTRILYTWANDGIAPHIKGIVNYPGLFPWTIGKLRQGKIVKFSHPQELPDEAAIDRKNFIHYNEQSHLTVPVEIGGNMMGALSISVIRTHRNWPKELIQRLRLIAEITANTIVRKQKEIEIRNAFHEINYLKNQLEVDKNYLQEELSLTFDFHNMIGQSPPLNQLVSKIKQVAATDVRVFIHGETGTGKELVARAIHAASRRNHRPMVKVNCAALPANLIESELFGYEKGAFTGADRKQVGRFELANGGTLFLDEIGELPLESQSKLLRVLQEGEIERLGNARTIKVDVRVIAATNRNIENEVHRGRFRQDLWYRLSVFPIRVPPLSERMDDIPLLVNFFIKKFSRKMGRKITDIPSKLLNTLQNYHWPGNIRELENVIERAVINTHGGSLQLMDTLGISLPERKSHPLRGSLNTPTRQAQPEEDTTFPNTLSLQDVERSHITRVLKKTQWRIAGPNGAATLLDLHPSTLRSRIQKLGIKRSIKAV